MVSPNNSNYSCTYENLNSILFLNIDFIDDINELSNFLLDIKENDLFLELIKKYEEVTKLKINIPIDKSLLNNFKTQIILKVIIDLVVYYKEIINNKIKLKDKLKLIIGYNYGIIPALVIGSYNDKQDYIIKSKSAINLINDLFQKRHNTYIFLKKIYNISLEDLPKNFNISIKNNNNHFLIYGDKVDLKNLQQYFITNYNIELDDCIIIYDFVVDLSFNKTFLNFNIPIYTENNILCKKNDLIIDYNANIYNYSDIIYKSLKEFNCQIIYYILKYNDFKNINYKHLFHSICNLKSEINDCFEKYTPKLIKKNSLFLENNYTKKTYRNPIFLQTNNINLSDLMILYILNSGYDYEIEIKDKCDIVKRIEYFCSNIQKCFGFILKFKKTHSIEFIKNILLSLKNYPIFSISLDYIPNKDEFSKILNILDINKIFNLYLEPKSFDELLIIIDYKLNKDFNIHLKLIEQKDMKFDYDFIIYYKLIRSIPNFSILLGKTSYLQNLYKYFTGEWFVSLPYLPVDGIIVSTPLFICEESCLELNAKDIIFNINKEIDLLSLDSNYFLVKETKAATLWKKYDDLYFKNKDYEKINKDYEKIIQELELNYSKKFFGNLEKLTYYQVIKQMTNLLTYNNSSNWIHKDFEKKTKDFIKRLLKIFDIKLGIGFEQDSYNIVKYIEDYSNKEWISPLFTTPIHITEKNFFLNLCKRPNEKIVNFIPIIDNNFEFWFKADIFWYNRNLDAVPNYNIQNTIIPSNSIDLYELDSVNKPICDYLNLINEAIFNHFNITIDNEYGSIEKSYENGYNLLNFINRENKTFFYRIFSSTDMCDINNHKKKNYFIDLLKSIKNKIIVTSKKNSLTIHIPNSFKYIWTIKDNLLYFEYKKTIFNYEINISSLYVVKELFDKKIKDIIFTDNQYTISLSKNIKLDIKNNNNLNTIFLSSKCQNIIENYINSNLDLDINILNIKYLNYSIKIEKNIKKILDETFEFNINHFKKHRSIRFEIDIIIKKNIYMKIKYDIQNLYDINYKIYNIHINDEYMLFFLNNCNIKFDEEIKIGDFLIINNYKVLKNDVCIGNIISMEPNFIKFLDSNNISDEPSYIDEINSSTYNVLLENDNFYNEYFDIKKNINKDFLYNKIYNNTPNFNINYVIYEIIKYENIDIYQFNYKSIEEINYHKITINKSYIGKYKSADIFKFKIYNKEKIIGILEIFTKTQKQIQIYPNNCYLSSNNINQFYNNFPIVKNIIDKIDLFFLQNYDISILNIILYNTKSIKIIKKNDIIKKNYENIFDNTIIEFENEDGLLEHDVFRDLFNLIIQYSLFKLYKNNNIISDDSIFFGIEIGLISALICSIDINILEIFELIYIKNIVNFLKKDKVPKLFDKLIIDNFDSFKSIETIYHPFINKSYRFSNIIFENVDLDSYKKDIIFTDEQNYDIFLFYRILFNEYEKFEYCDSIDDFLKSKKFDCIYEYSVKRVLSNKLDNNSDYKLFDNL